MRGIKELSVSLAGSDEPWNVKSLEASLDMAPAADIVILPFAVSLEAKDVDLIETSKRWAKDKAKWAILGPIAKASGTKVFNHLYVINDGGGLEALCERPNKIASFFSYRGLLVGCITCEELLSPENVSIAARGGARVLFAIGKRPSIGPEAFEALVRVRALENAAFLLASYGDSFWAFSPGGEAICETDARTISLAKLDHLMARRMHKPSYAVGRS
jgi:predicted amidohydrolase